MTKYYFNAGDIFTWVSTPSIPSEHNPTYLQFLEGNLYSELLKSVYMNLSLYYEGEEFRIILNTGTYVVNADNIKKNISKSLDSPRTKECNPDNEKFITKVLVKVLEQIDNIKVQREKEQEFIKDKNE